LWQLQAYVWRTKNQKVRGIQVKSFSDMIAVSQSLSLPPTLALVNAAPPMALVESTVSQALYVPMHASAYSVHGVCYTGKHQIGWIGQLVGMEGDWTVHIDGKYKLHHSKFLLLTLGTHHLRFSIHGGLTTSFVPLMYLFCKEGESDGAAQLVVDAVNATALKYFGKKLKPGAGSTDHAPALRKALEDTWPDMEYGQCYPHLIRKFGEGEYCSKKWVHMDESLDMIRHINLAHSTGQKYLIIDEAGKLWDKWGHEMDTFWDSNLTDPWDCWSICDMETMIATPSNQAQESWHKQLLLSRIPGMFKGSTKKVVTEALPQIVTLDGKFIPDILCFDVPAVPRGVLEKGLWYAQHKSTHVHMERDGKGGFIWYILVKDNKAGLKKVTNTSLKDYIGTLNGEKSSRIKTYDQLINTCYSYHYLLEPTKYERRIPECSYNVAKLACVTCKGFKQYGICSHVCAINHLLGKYDLEDDLKELSQKRKKGGYRKGVRPALVREKEAESDSSEDEPLSRRLLKNQKKK